MNIEEVYEELKIIHEEGLKEQGVQLPRLKTGSSYTKRILGLVFLYVNRDRNVTKDELTEFVKQYHPNTKDYQDGRHLSRQLGWYIASGRRKDVVDFDLPSNSYRFVSTTKKYPGASGSTRKTAITAKDFTELKSKYENSCATCGSVEGEPSKKNPSIITTIQKGHMDPNKDLKDNVIPQCEECNRAYLDRFIFDNTGRVIDININSPRWRGIYVRVE